MKIKGFDKDLKCRGFQFEIGKEYDTGVPDDKLELCSDTVFHYCDSLQQVHEYYNCTEDNRYCEIEVLGKEITDGEKCGSNRIRIVREITGDELKALKGLERGNTGLFNTGHWNTGNWNTGDWNTGHWNTGNWNTGHQNTGNQNTGHWNTGFANACNGSNGVFCNEDDRNIRIFNRPSGMSLQEFYASRYYAALRSAPFVLTEWVEYKEEEKDTEEKKALGGYLKECDYKEAWKNFWERLSEENRKIIQEIPNFDAEIFFDITGIDLREAK